MKFTPAYNKGQHPRGYPEFVNVFKRTFECPYAPCPLLISSFLIVPAPEEITTNLDVGLKSGSTALNRINGPNTCNSFSV